MTPHRDATGITPLNSTLNPNTNTPALVENNDDEFETHRLIVASSSRDIVASSSREIVASTSRHIVASSSRDIVASSSRDIASSSRDVSDIASSSRDVDVAMNLPGNAKFPPGYRFCPTDGELIYYYLQRKIMNLQLPHDKIRDVTLSSFNPEQLCGMYLPLGDNEWYFFTPRDRKYVNGERPNRAAGTGYWKATGPDKNIPHPHDKTQLIGHKKTLVFHEGRPPRGVRSNWIMHEYKTEKKSSRKRLNDTDMRLDDWVLCRIYNKNDKYPRGNNIIKVENGDEGNPNLVDDLFIPSLPVPDMGVEDEKLATQTEPIADFNNDYTENSPDSFLNYPRPLSPQLPAFPPTFSQHPDLPQTYLDSFYLEEHLYNFDDFQPGFQIRDVKPLPPLKISEPDYSQPTDFQHGFHIRDVEPLPPFKISEPDHSPSLSHDKFMQIPKCCNGEKTSVPLGTNDTFRPMSCNSDTSMEKCDQKNNIDNNDFLSMLDFELDDVNGSK